MGARQVALGFWSGRLDGWWATPWWRHEEARKVRCRAPVLQWWGGSLWGGSAARGGAFPFGFGRGHRRCERMKFWSGSWEQTGSSHNCGGKVVEQVTPSAGESLSILSTPTTVVCMCVGGVYLTACFEFSLPESSQRQEHLRVPLPPSPHCSLLNSDCGSSGL